MLKRIFAAFLVFTAALMATETVVPPNDPNLAYHGRIIKGYGFVWPGSGVEFCAEASAVTFSLSDKNGRSYYNVVIDGTVVDFFKTKPGVHDYTFSNFTPGARTFMLTRRNEQTEGPTYLKAITLEDGALFPKPPPKERRIEFYGDSLTASMGILAEEGENEDNPATWNNYLSYAAVTARNVNAEYRAIAKSGIGVTVSWFPETMPDIWDRVDPSKKKPKNDFAAWVPDVVVVNLGQNDYWLYKKPEYITPTPARDTLKANYSAFIKNIRRVYPNAEIFCALGPMDAVANARWVALHKEAVAELNDPKTHWIIFPYTPLFAHPKIADHAKMADVLTEAIKTAMGW